MENAMSTPGTSAILVSTMYSLYRRGSIQTPSMARLLAARRMSRRAEGGRSRSKTAICMGF